MSGFKFVKMHGAGNDFVMIDDRVEEFPLNDSALMARLANRPDGVGCEGVIFVRPAKGDADFSMRFFNPDGGEAEMCGNGARCVAAFARSIGAAKSDRMRFETKAGITEATILEDGCVRLLMPDPRDIRSDFINSGVPHKVVPVDDLENAAVFEEGRRIRYSDEFAPAGTNVDFVKYLPPHEAHIRTYERGVEAETFACGTGSIAAALIGVAQYGMSFPVNVITRDGYELVIDGVFSDGAFAAVTLTGPVKKVFEGVFA